VLSERRNEGAFQGAPFVSVVVPTRDEIDNIAPLLERLAHVATDTSMEIIFVDDSSDGTDEEIRRLAQEYERDVILVHREREERWGGLGGAVVDGMRRARGAWVCVMDGDLQHPPEMLEDMIDAARERSADLVVASRFCEGGSPGAFGRMRAVLSKGSTALARVCFPRTLHGVTDPMSGFFLVRHAALEVERLKPQGFKILLEVLVREPWLRRTEVPFTFGERYAGESKTSVAEARNYLVHLGRLRVQMAARLMRFVAVGVSGLAVNTLLLALFTDVSGLYYLLSALLATQGSTLWNFALTERWVFRGAEHRHSYRRRMAMFFVINNIALGLRGPMLFVLTSAVGIHYLVSNIISLGALTIIRFVVADSWIWARQHLRGAKRTNRYDIHGIVRVESVVALPELEAFRVESLSKPPTLSVRIGKVGTTAAARKDRLVYDEGLGRAGFATQITRGGTIDIVATPLLRRSPHVLYTNIVEPVLRWTFAEYGYALVHGACIAVGERAFLITARTDTGKTTTILKTLDGHPAISFLSDDLTLLRPDGTVLAYPKPMTISLHTVSAVKTPLLTRRERMTLVFQSRIHSKSGRRFAFLLTKLKLPVATINTLVQLIVPPPKYHVERLVPEASVAESAKLSQLLVIQRGEDATRELPAAEALTTLLENCEDAYGFPPYAEIAEFLHSGNGHDLRAMERETIRQALAGVPATELTSSQRDWWLYARTLVDPTSEDTEEKVVPVGLETGIPAESLGLT
jgi:dolichol-phosphate mannosyltransferase